MDQKVTTILDERLFRRATTESRRQGKPLDRLLGEALEFYLDEKTGAPKEGGVAARSWGALKLAPDALKALLEQEDDFLDA
jgi:hypothetical protein